ncbi:unnamed protein product [Rotaria socialis]
MARAFCPKSAVIALMLYIVLAGLIGITICGMKWNGESIHVNLDIYKQESKKELLNENCKTTKPTLIFTCLGEKAFTSYQLYIWEAMEQARLTNPNIRMTVILNRAAYTTLNADKFRLLRISVAFSDDLYNGNTLFQEFQQKFFEKGAMKPNGNEKFVQYVVERLVALYAYMNQTKLCNVFHMENDNMLYIDLNRLAMRMLECNVSIAIPRAAIDQAVMSFIFVKSSRIMEHFVEWCVNVFRMGPEKAVKFLNTSWINDMTLGARYLQLFATSNEQSKITGVFELPTWINERNESCCLCKMTQNDAIIFDACVLGQYFGGTFSNPNQKHWEMNRLVDPRGLLLDWRPSEHGAHKHPYIIGIKIANIHVHSKKLARFSSIRGSQFNSL